MTLYTTSDKKFLDATPLGVAQTHFFPLKPLPQQCDKMIVTSKNVIVSLEKSGLKWNHLPLVCVGEKTGLFAQIYGANVAFTAQGYGEDLAHYLVSNHKNSHFFYPHAKKVAFDIASVLTTHAIKFEESIAYETMCSTQKIDINDDAVIVFGAPSHIECFLSLYGWKNMWRAVAIGRTTAQAFPPDITPLISPTPSYEDAITFVTNL